MQIDDAGAWTAFWEEQGPHGRCIDGDALDPMAAEWARYAASLPADAQVLDLACGAGFVGRILLSKRSDLRIVGVDYAVAPQQSDPRHRILFPVRMEALPLADSSFDAAVSQFGIEYGNVEEIGRELLRVLKPSAPFLFLVHHKDSPISREAQSRRAALGELTSNSVEDSFVAGDRIGLLKEFQRLRDAYPGEALVEIFAGSLPDRTGGTREQRQAAWDDIKDACEPEMSMLTQMGKAGKAEAELGVWLQPLERVFSGLTVETLRDGNGDPLVWKVSGVRAA